MIYEFKQNITGLLFTADITDIVFACDKSAIFTIANNSNIIFSTKYFPTPDNLITVHGIRDIIETYLFNSGLVITQFTIKFDLSDNDDYSNTFTAVHCNINIGFEAETYIYNSFLTTLKSKCTCSGMPEYLTVITDKNETVIIKGIDNNGISFAFDFFEIQSSSITASFMDVRYDIVLSKLKESNPYVSEIKAYTVICGNRYCSFYNNKSLEYSLCFQFRNCFNATETYICSGSVKKILSVNSDTAITNNTVSQYNFSATASYETETATLMNESADWVTQFLSSRKIKLCDTAYVSGNADIIITDNTFEQSTDETKAAKFTWRFCNNTIRTIYQDKRVNLECFTNQYDYQYD